MNRSLPDPLTPAAGAATVPPETITAREAPAPCPLCGAPGAGPGEELAGAALCELYQHQFAVDVERILSRNVRLALIRCSGCGLLHFSPAITGDGRFYDELQRQPWYYQQAKYEYDFVAGLILPGARVLDIGSGEGAFAGHLPEGVAYTGLDLSSEARRKAGTRGVRVMNEPIEHHAARSEGSYDWVVSFQSLEHVANPREFLAAAGRCVAPGGRLALSVPSHDSFLRFAANVPLNMPPHHVTLWPDSALREAARAAGLRLELLHHEPLQDMHVDWALSVMAHALLGGGRRRIEHTGGLPGRLRARAARVIARFLRRRLPADFWPRGHSVVAVCAR